jgi:hypothetical protein
MADNDDAETSSESGNVSYPDDDFGADPSALDDVSTPAAPAPVPVPYPNQAEDERPGLGVNRDSPFPDGDASAGNSLDIRDIIGGEDSPNVSGIVDDGGGTDDPLANVFVTGGHVAPSADIADTGAEILPTPDPAPSPDEEPSEPDYPYVPDGGDSDRAAEGGE